MIANMKSRRDFLRLGGSFVSAAGFSRFGLMNALAQTPPNYKALVCIFLFGGNDGHNTVVPASLCGFAVRGSLDDSTAGLCEKGGLGPRALLVARAEHDRMPGSRQPRAKPAAFFACATEDSDDHAVLPRYPDAAMRCWMSSVGRSRSRPRAPGKPRTLTRIANRLERARVFER